MAALNLSLETNRGVSREGFLEGTPPAFIETVFEMEPNELRVLSTAGDAWLVRLDAVVSPDPSTPEAQATREQFAVRTSAELSTAIIQAYTQALIDEFGVDVNQTAINAVNAQLP